MYCSFFPGRVPFAIFCNTFDNRTKYRCVESPGGANKLKGVKHVVRTWQQSIGLRTSNARTNKSQKEETSNDL